MFSLQKKKSVDSGIYVLMSSDLHIEKKNYYI